MIRPQENLKILSLQLSFTRSIFTFFCDPFPDLYCYHLTPPPFPGAMGVLKKGAGIGLHWLHIAAQSYRMMVW